MKKFYQLLLTATLLLITGLAANAHTVTFKWDNPGAVSISYDNKTVDLTPDQTEVTLSYDDDYTTITVSPNSGYMIKGATYTGAKEGTLRPSSGNIYAQFIKYNDCVISIETEKYAMDDVLTFDIVNGYDKITEIKLSNTKTIIPINSNGIHIVKFSAAKDQELTFSPLSGFTPYLITIDGEPAVMKWSWQGFYTIPIKNGSVIKFQAYEETGPKTHEVTFDFRNQGKDALTSIYNRTLMKQVDFSASDKIEVEDGNTLSFNFKDDYNVSISANGTSLSLFDYSTSATITAPTTIVIDATAKVYSNRYVTAYISSPEGVEIYAGNRLNGQKVEIDVTKAKPVTSNINLPSSDVDGPVTMYADKTYEFNLEMSTKYPTYNIYTKEGYWLQTARLANTAKYADNPLDASIVYIAAKPVERTDKAVVYIQGPYENIKLDPSATYGSSRKISFDNDGYTEFDFEAAYESPYTIRTGAIIDGMQVYLDGVAQARDENEVFSGIQLKNNSVLKIFTDGKSHSTKPVTFEVQDGATADVTYDRVLHLEDFTTPLQCFPGTEFAIIPGPKTDVLLNGEKIYPEEDGTCYLSIDEAEPQHVVTLAYKGGDPRTYILFPESGETVESLEAIRISFPYAEYAFLSEEFDPSDIMLVKTDNSWAGMNPEVERLQGADCPTFIISFPVAPTSLGNYRFNISPGAFTLDGQASTEIAAEYELKYEYSGDLEYTVDPAGDIVAGPWFLGGAFIFDESMTITDYNGAKAVTTVEFNGTKLADNQFSVEVWGNMFMVTVLDQNLLGKTGILHINVKAGAFKVTGQESPELDHTWNVIEPKSYTFQFSPDITSGKPINIFESIIVTIPEAETAFVDMESGISLRNGSYTYFETATIEPVEASTLAARSTGVSFKITFDPMPKSAGQYTLSMNSFTFCCDGAQYPDDFTTTFNYTATTGVDDITVDAAADNTIYNLQGVRIEAEWNDLPAGLYIRGGKKVLKH